MKTIIYLILFCPLISVAQHTTTDIEYNYLTKGYKTDLAEGRDIKSGYRMDPMGQEYAIGAYTFQFSAFTKIDEKAVAAVLVVAKSKTWGNVYYLCIPLNNQQLYGLYLQELEKWDASISRAYSYLASTLFAGLAARDINLEMQK